jgi:hypothetical protein
MTHFESLSMMVQLLCQNLIRIYFTKFLHTISHIEFFVDFSFIIEGDIF